MKIAIASDHRGVAQKAAVARAAEALGHETQNMGPHTEDPVDYPDFAFKVARAVASGRADRGVLICGTGIGMSLAANKVNGIRAAVCHDEQTTKLSRQHNDANVLCLGSAVLDEDEIERLVRVWLATEHEGGRHARRVQKIMAAEKPRNGTGQTLKDEL